MSRYDKYVPGVSGYRAPLAADFTDPTNFNKLLGVGHDVNGRLVVGAGVTGVKAVLVLTKRHLAGDVVDPMDCGEVVEFDPVTAGVDGAPGTDYYSAADGTISTTSTGTFVGHTVEGSRIIVRVKRG